MDPGEINSMRKAQKKSEFEVWEENWEAVSIFLRCQTQWRMSMAGPVGLDYSALAWILRLCETKDQLTVLDQIQVIESVILQAIKQRG